MTRTRYYVGLVTQNGHAVSEATQDKLCQFVADTHGGGCTAYHAVGYWQGARESSLVIEVLGDNVSPEVVTAELAALANQTCVLWTREQVEGGFAP